MSAEFSERVKREVWRRAQGRCERCCRRLDPRSGHSYHHRRMKGYGGDQRLTSRQPANCLLLCGSGTTGCHGFVHEHQALARDLGWIVSRYAEPEEVPVRTYYGLVRLDNAGGWEKIVAA